MTLHHMAPTSLATEALATLLPMHLLLDDHDTIAGIGPTLRRLLDIPSGGTDLEAVLQDARADDSRPLGDVIRTAARCEERLFLRMRKPPHLGLRGHAVGTAAGGVLVNLGLGINLRDAVDHAGLTDADFAPPELAMELMFLQEANRAVMSELSRFNTQLDEARAQAELRAHTDPLTGLTNRRGLELALTAAIGDCRSGRRPAGFALAHLDLDGFKAVNDTLGHPAGDDVLCQVAQILRDMTRHNDTVARIGGDEFVLILGGAVDMTILDRLARRIIDGIEQGTRIEGRRVDVSASIGIVLSRSYRDQPLLHMLRDADAALYQAKRDGRRQARIMATLPGDPADTVVAGSVRSGDIA